eukprot:TRINITY_DN1833_c0_g1_i1.p1 TRINITY_DN1833_c0_g1~~TRINITY_DN1833_c0_g1_i1.p1  ORF type:complete len:378 (-),score=118.01 TRINITY_DN1833_c0_g1_i1:337-1470(-)
MKIVTVGSSPKPPPPPQPATATAVAAKAPATVVVSSLSQSPATPTATVVETAPPVWIPSDGRTILSDEQQQQQQQQQEREHKIKSLEKKLELKEKQVHELEEKLKKEQTGVVVEREEAHHHCCLEMKFEAERASTQKILATTQAQLREKTDQLVKLQELFKQQVERADQVTKLNEELVQKVHTLEAKLREQSIIVAAATVPPQPQPQRQPLPPPATLVGMEVLKSKCLIDPQQSLRCRELLQMVGDFNASVATCHSVITSAGDHLGLHNNLQQMLQTCLDSLDSYSRKDKASAERFNLDPSDLLALALFTCDLGTGRREGSSGINAEYGAGVEDGPEGVVRRVPRVLLLRQGVLQVLVLHQLELLPVPVPVQVGVQA